MKENEYENDILEAVFPVFDIPEETNYWIMRASGGKYSKDFELNNRITLDSEDIDIKKVKSEYKNFRDIFKNHRLKAIEQDNKLSDSAQSITISSKKIFNFVHTIKVGDVVLVPTQQSQNFLIGVITDNAKQYEKFSTKNFISKFEDENIPLSKDKFYREVSWINKVPRYKVDPSLLYTLTMHQTLIKIEENTHHINSLLTPLYIKSNKLNLSLRVNKSGRISSEEWENFYFYLNKSKKENEDIAVKSNVQSPGKIDLSTLISATPDYIPLLLLMLLVTGGEIKYHELNFKLNGLFPYAKNKLLEKKQKKEDERETPNTTENFNPDNRNSENINVKYNELSENQKANLKNMIQTLDLSIDDVQKLAENSLNSSNQNERE